MTDTPATIDNDAEAALLTDRQQRFVMEYLKDQNASAAARRCGYSQRSAACQGAALLRIPAVRDRIRTELRALMAEAGVTLIELVRERVKAAYFRNGRMFGEDGRLLTPAEMPRDMLELLEISVVWRKGEPILRLKQPSRERALSALEKLLERLDKQDEKYDDQLRWEQPEPGEGVENDPRLDEKPVDLWGSGEPNPAGMRPSTSSGRTDVGDEIPEKPTALSGLRNPVPQKHHHLSRSGRPNEPQPQAP